MCRESAVLSGFSAADEHIGAFVVGHGGYTEPILQIWGKEGRICWNLGDWTAFFFSSRTLSAYRCILQKNADLNLDPAIVNDIR
ncbi:hypothetical protein AMECASPLE_025733 [Ameca splendens]|uniref:Uncharacterized protein n=1 Tax=Ameca splendens TaxID=208324 RepID=A0ABV0XTQ3_9TELE